MLAKSFLSSLALAAAALAPTARAQLVDVPLGVTVDLGNSATCPAPAPGGDVEANVLAVVTLDTVIEAGIDVLGLGLVGADIDLSVDVCLCIGAEVDISLVTLPVSLEAGLIADVTDLIGDLEVGITVPGVGSLLDLLENDLTDIDVTTRGESAEPCVCPEEATPTCVNATCSCACPPGFFYNSITQECVVAPSGLTRVKRNRNTSADIRQAKRRDIEARLQRAGFY